MNDIDTLLRDAGERWRATQPDPRSINPATFAIAPAGRGSLPMSIAGSFAAALVLIAGVLVMVGQLGRSPGVGGAPPGGSSLAPSAAATPAEASPSIDASPSPSISPRDPPCAITRPAEPFFVPPAEFLAAPPRSYGEEWHGTADLWTAIQQDGQVWRDLPHNPDGWTQKTFWWSANWTPAEEPEPAITISGLRLDAPGTFEFGPGTNATAPGINTAMLVGIDVPALGCWEITATYREASLSFVVLVAE